MVDVKYDKRILARVVLEAETPLSIGSGVKTVLTDSPILKDVNGFPYIPGSSIAGVIRHSLGEDKAKLLFGFKDNRNDDDCSATNGSRIIISEARLVGLDGKVLDGILDFDRLDENLTSRFAKLPKRNHVRLSDKGTAEDKGKFDEEVIYKGARFVFDIELVMSAEDDPEPLDDVLAELRKETFRIGGGSRSGFGKVKVVSLLKREFDLRKAEELDEYLKCSSSLCSDHSGWREMANCSIDATGWIKYDLTLTPEDFFLFGAGFGDEDVDEKSVTESYIWWNAESGRGEFIDNALLIPAASLKGSLSHRVAFYYNIKDEAFAMETDAAEFKNHCGGKNEAVRALFGWQDGDSEDSRKRGMCLFSDIIGEYKTGEKVLNHVSIDRFTGGAIDGALFSEKAVDGKDRHLEFKTSILVKKPSEMSDGFAKALACLELALGDIDRGTLPLGGGSGRGHGIFKCKWTKTEL